MGRLFVDKVMAVSVGCIGLGTVGSPTAGNVLKNGFATTLFDKNPKAMERLVGANAARDLQLGSL
jgi:3-hydroxyisobutyrate dehydrogenase-like beta-hydroxyacid dehydrogenase